MKRNFAIVAGVVLLLCLGFAIGRISTNKGSEATTTGRRILYYVDPMHPAYRSDKPGIAPDCGMALEPVYEGQSNAAQVALPAGGISLSPERQRMVGIRVAVATRSAGLRAIRTTGRVLPEDNRLYKIQAGFEGWAESLTETPTGTLVKKDQILGTLYGPDIRTAVLNYVAFISGVQRVRQGLTQGDMKSIDESQRVNEEQLRLLGMGEKEIQEIANSHRATSSIYLVSPADGIILSRSISPRQRFEKGAELYRIADLSKIWIVADVHGTEGEFHPGMRVKVNVPEVGKTIQAIVTPTIPLFDEASRTLKVRLEADNPGFILRPDMFVDVQFEAKVPDGITIPAEAVLDSGLRKIVYVETADDVFEPRPVQVEKVYGDQVIITGKVSEGDRIVVSGNFLLDSESRMRATTQPATAETPLSGQVKQASLDLMKSSGKGSAADGETRDPVCGMTLKLSEVAFQKNYNGKTFRFCSETCRNKFLANPEKYAGSPESGLAKTDDKAARPHD